jgi:hypothetical protein
MFDVHLFNSVIDVHLSKQPETFTLPNGIYFSVYSIGVKFFTEDKRSVFNRGVTLTPEPLNL